jgi:anti-sigma factor RsiW
MAACTFEPTVERWFDGEAVDEAAVRAHLDACDGCRTYADRLKQIRSGLTAARAEAPTIDEAQVPAFLRELEKRVQAEPPRRHVSWFAFASVAAAAVVVAVSVMTLIPTNGPKQIEATEIEETSTEIDGATTETTISDDGTATVWVNLPEGDLW